MQREGDAWQATATWDVSATALETPGAEVAVRVGGEVVYPEEPWGLAW